MTTMTQVAVRWMSIMALVMSVRHDRLAGLPMWAEAAYSAPNFPPKFVSTDGTSYASEIIVHVREGPTDVGKQIARLVGKDADNDHLTFGVMGTIASEIVRVENSGDNEANVYLRKELDRETRDSYAVVLTLTDGKLGKGNFITRTMLIIVEDINDEAPVFRPFRTTIRLSEDASPAIVETVEALDADEGSFGQVLYRLEEVDKDLSAPATFAIETNQSKGIISLVGKLDFERKSFHQLKIIAYDQAPEGQRKTATAMLLVKIDDAEDEDPIFTVVPSVTRVPENQRPGTQVLRVAAIDGDRGVNNPVSYRINKGGRGLFAIDPLTGIVLVNGSLDRETLVTDGQSGSTAYVLEISATEMNNGRIVPSPWVTCEVIIEVKDVNDNPPKFARKVFTGGVTTDQFYGTVFMSVKASDADAGVNSQISYYVYGPIRRSLDVGLDHLQQDPFLVNRRTGEISLNFDPRKEMKGYFEFQVLANDTGGLYDTANVYIYLLREDQRVRFVLWLAPQELREKLDKFIDILSNITGAMVNVDSYKFYENEDGTVDKQRTVLYLHFVDPADNSVMEVDTVLSLIDKNHMFLNELYREFHVLLGEASVFNEEYLAWDDQVKAGLVGSTAFLALLLILVICLCLNQRSRYKRQLRAATATSYGPRDPQLSRANVPNTNIHADEGSNPIWMTGYDNEWYDKDEEQLSTGSTGNSLDENAVAEVTTGPATPTDSLSGSGRGSDLSANDRQALCRGIGGRLTPNNIVLPNKGRTNTVQGKKLSAPKPPTPPTLRGGDGQGSVNTSDSQSVSCKNSVNTIYISSSYPSSQQSHYHHNQQHQGNNLSIISLETTEL